MSRRPVPLMFINSPSVISRIRIQSEESTSIFVKHDSIEKEEELPVEITEENSSEEKHILPSIEKQLNKIQSPFGRHLYRPVELQLNDEQTFIGDIESIEDENVFLKVEENEKVIPIQMANIIDILWRGKSIPEK